MKRMIALVLLAVMIMTLAACRQVPQGTTVQTVVKDSELVTLIIDFDKQTITVSDDKHSAIAVGSDGTLLGSTSAEKGDVYRYTYDHDDITITYPNGATWWESSTVGGWDDDYDPERYLDGDILARMLTQAYQTARQNGGKVVLIGVVCLLVIGVGVVSVMHPEFLYELRYGLWFENVEPTEFALFMSRLCGVIVIVGAVIVFLVTAFS